MTTKSQEKWHAMDEEEVLQHLESGTEGLSERLAEERIQEYGKNMLPGKRAITLLEVILHQLMSPFIYILIAAGVVSVIIGEATDAVFIFLVIAINAFLGTTQEWKAEQSASSLESFLKTNSRVKRDGRVREINADELVPGDIVLLESGERVPADIRLLRAVSLFQDEAFLTGESLPVEKRSETVSGDAPVSDRTSMAFAGSIVTGGRGEGVVVATGIHTEIGAISREVAGPSEAKTPLVIRMEAFVKKITYAILGAGVLLSIVALSRGIPYTEVFFMAVALAVSAIPEGLPVSMTVALSISTTRMARRNVIVRKLNAVEGLGSCTCICTDKTGTLTMNQQTVRMLVLPNGNRFTVSGEGYGGEGEILDEKAEKLSDSARHDVDRLVRSSVLVNEGKLSRENGEWKHRGDTVDVALLALGYKMGLNPNQVRSEAETVGEIPFESERRYAARFYREDETVHVAVKGALETLLPHCGPGEHGIDLESIEKEADRLGNDGFRVLAVAHGKLDSLPEKEEFDEEDLPDLDLLGLVGMIDPLRPETADAVAKCQQAGVKVVMITGDQPGTALAIARDLQIAFSSDEVISGRQLETLGDPDSAEFMENVKDTAVFARVTPVQKLYIVEALMRAGHLVAVTGDGVNDAPALQKANLGVAMGSGTDLAKDVSELIVTDDNFASIEAGIEEGRNAYASIRKVIYLLVATGAAEVVLFTLAILIGLPIPLLAVQILWLNLVTNGIQDKALVFEPGEEGIMSRPPRRPEEGVFDSLMVKQILVSGLFMGFVTLVAWWWMLRSGWDEAGARNLLLLLIVLFQNIHIFNCRSETLSTFSISLRKNLFLIVAVIGAQGVHLLATQSALMQGVLKVQPVSLVNWAYLLLVAFSVLAAMEAFKLFQGRSPGGARTQQE